MKPKLHNNQLKFSFDSSIAKESANAERNPKIVRFDPKSELYKKILKRIP